MKKANVTTNELAEKHDELMNFLKEHMVMRADLERYATRDDLMMVKSELITAIDGIAKSNRILDSEVTVWRSRTDELIAQMSVVQTKLVLAA